MVQGITDDGVVFIQQNLKQAAIGVEATGIQDGIAHFQEAGQGLFQLFVARLRTANKTYGSQPKAGVVQPLLGGVNQARVVGQAQVVVCTKIQHLRPVGQANLRRLLTGHYALGFVKAVGAQLLDLMLYVIEKRALHEKACPLRKRALVYLSMWQQTPPLEPAIYAPGAP